MSENQNYSNTIMKDEEEANKSIDESVELNQLTDNDEIGKVKALCDENIIVCPSNSPVETDMQIERALVFCGIAIGAYIGSMIRIGISYYRIWKTETNYCVLYTQIIGCIIFGFVSKHKHFMCVDSRTSSRFSRVLFVSLTSGLCGSITTFSGWQVECNKNFILQWDASWGNLFATYNGGRLFEWIVSLWTGVVVPLMALHLGHHLALFLSHHNDKIEASIIIENAKTTASTAQDNTNSTIVDNIEKNKNINETNVMLSAGEVSLVVLFVVSTILLVVLPISLSPHLTYTAVFGVAGAYLRYLLSVLNVEQDQFPLGTFIANVFGSWLQGALWILSKFVVSYHDLSSQAVLSGLIQGFCGCLTTMSTFVNEIDTLPLWPSYRYGLASTAAAQLGLVLINNVYSFHSVTDSAHSAITLPTIDLCSVSQSLCATLLTHLDCPENAWLNTACTDMSDYRAYTGLCGCGDFTTERVSQLLVDSQVSLSIVPSSLVSVWPTDAAENREPTAVFDYCLTYENACDDYLTRIACPASLRVINGCSRRGLLDANSESKCECGGNTVASSRISQLISDVSLKRRFDLVPYNGFVTLGTVNLDAAYQTVCVAMLDHVQCPSDERRIRGNAEPDRYDTWVGDCTCGDHYTVNSRTVLSSLFSAVVKPNLPKLLVTAVNSTMQAPKWDICSSCANACTFWLESFDCPSDLRQVSACGGIPDGGWNMTATICACGNLTSVSRTVFDSIADMVVAQQLWTEFYFIPPASAPYTAMVASNPTRQLFLPMQTLPA